MKKIFTLHHKKIIHPNIFCYNVIRHVKSSYHAFPNLATRPELSWTHYKELLPVKDREKRREYIDKIKEDSLSVRELRELITDEEQKQAPVLDTTPKKEKLSFLRGIPFVYKIKRIDCLKPENSKLVVTEKGKYLNQELADKGYCRIVPGQ
jgi:hypothetical protein